LWPVVQVAVVPEDLVVDMLGLQVVDLEECVQEMPYLNQATILLPLAPVVMAKLVQDQKDQMVAILWLVQPHLPAVEVEELVLQIHQD
jgi:hypothetical protein